MRTKNEMLHLSKRMGFDGPLTPTVEAILQCKPWGSHLPLEVLAIGLTDRPGEDWCTPVRFLDCLDFEEDQDAIVEIAAFDLWKLQGKAPTRVLIVHAGELKINAPAPTPPSCIYVPAPPPLA